MYTFTVDPASLPSGSLDLRVQAEDKAGNTGEVALRANVDRTPPAVVWRRPADGAEVSGTVPLEVEATDNVGVAKVEFLAGSTKLGGATSAPFTFSWNTLSYPDGPVTLKARAVDAAGNAAEATLTVTVANQPGVFWINPVPNQEVAGLVTLRVEVRANRPVDRWSFTSVPMKTPWPRSLARLRSLATYTLWIGMCFGSPLETIS